MTPVEKWRILRHHHRVRAIFKLKSKGSKVLKTNTSYIIIMVIGSRGRWKKERKMDGVCTTTQMERFMMGASYKTKYMGLESTPFLMAQSTMENGSRELNTVSECLSLAMAINIMADSRRML